MYKKSSSCSPQQSAVFRIAIRNIESGIVENLPISFGLLRLVFFLLFSFFCALLYIIYSSCLRLQAYMQGRERKGKERRARSQRYFNCNTLTNERTNDNIRFIFVVAGFKRKFYALLNSVNMRYTLMGLPSDTQSFHFRIFFFSSSSN